MMATVWNLCARELVRSGIQPQVNTMWHTKADEEVKEKSWILQTQDQQTMRPR